MSDSPPRDPAKAPTPAPQFRTAALSHRKVTRFDWAPDAAGKAALARDLDLISLPFARLRGEIQPTGRNDFTLQAQLEAEAVQACVVTLAPVTARLSDAVTRRYLADFTTPEGDEVEMPEDDSAEPLPELIDIADVLREALVLTLPPWPRAPGAELGEVVQAPPGVTPLRDADLRPFAALAQLRKADTPPETDGS